MDHWRRIGSTNQLIPFASEAPEVSIQLDKKCYIMAFTQAQQVLGFLLIILGTAEAMSYRIALSHISSDT